MTTHRKHGPADDDRRVKEAAEARNIADTLVYATEKTVKDLGDKVPEEMKTEVEAEIAAVKSSLEGDDTDTIKEATEKLQAASYKLAEIVYADAQAASGEGEGGDEGAATEPAEEEEVADFEVVDEDKK